MFLVCGFKNFALVCKHARLHDAMCLRVGVFAGAWTSCWELLLVTFTSSSHSNIHKILVAQRYWKRRNFCKYIHVHTYRHYGMFAVSSLPDYLGSLYDLTLLALQMSYRMCVTILLFYWTGFGFSRIGVAASLDSVWRHSHGLRRRTTMMAAALDIAGVAVVND